MPPLCKLPPLLPPRRRFLSCWSRACVASIRGLPQTKAEAAAAATKAKQPISHAQRSLAKVNKKGMKSISSFFGKK